jgi:hypothetical protein
MRNRRVHASDRCVRAPSDGHMSSQTPRRVTADSTGRCNDVDERPFLPGYEAQMQCSAQCMPTRSTDGCIGFRVEASRSAGRIAAFRHSAASMRSLHAGSRSDARRACTCIMCAHRDTQPDRSKHGSSIAKTALALDQRPQTQDGCFVGPLRHQLNADGQVL